MGVSKQIILTSFILVNECSEGTWIFICLIIKISSRKWWKQKHGTEYRLLSSDQFNHLHTNFLFYHNQYFVTLKAEVRIHILLSTSCKIIR